jgi:cell wall-associated NlpC family hydrolase
MLPAAVYEAAGAIPHLEPRIFFAMDDASRRRALSGGDPPLSRARSTIDEIQPADLIVWKFGRTYSHSAIVIEPPIVLHAVLKGGAVIRADISRDEDLRTRSGSHSASSTKSGELLRKGRSADGRRLENAHGRSKFAGMAIQTSLLGQPITLGWGRGRASCNLIDFVAFQAFRTRRQTKTGGKGGGGELDEQRRRTHTRRA